MLFRFLNRIIEIIFALPRTIIYLLIPFHVCGFFFIAYFGALVWRPYAEITGDMDGFPLKPFILFTLAVAFIVAAITIEYEKSEDELGLPPELAPNGFLRLSEEPHKRHINKRMLGGE